MNEHISIWTDGSCSIVDRVGGWGAVIIMNDVKFEISGTAVKTTANRMELMGAINGLRLVRTPSNITLFTDSMYVHNGIKNRGWLKRGSDNPNFSLWKKMVKLLDYHMHVKPMWVKGHSGLEYNERADVLAGNARRRKVRRLNNV